MTRLRLTRVSEFCNSTFGVLCIDDSPLFVTCEDVWSDNARNISCIPEGKYRVVLHRSPKFGVCYKVDDVSGRDHILIHSGNTNKDTQGCILLGKQFGVVGTDPGVISSRVAMQEFMREMSGVLEAELVIVSAFDRGRLH